MNQRTGKRFIALATGIGFLMGALLLMQCNVKMFLHASTRKAKHEVPVTYELGWWSNQNDLHIDSFSVSLLDSNLNMFNSKSLISYTVKGHLTYIGSWKPFIKKVHLSERFLTKDKRDTTDAEIIITPIVDTKQDNTKNGGTVPFAFTNQLLQNSFHWGSNKILFRCGAFQQMIEVWQKK
jgi:hypothetical protein